MTIPFNFIVIAEIAIIAQTLFAAGLLATTRFNQPANRFLAALMATIALWLIDNFFRIAGLYQQNANLYFLPIYYSLSFGPLLYFYVKSLVNSEFRFDWRRHSWHFIPVLLQTALYIGLSLSSYETRRLFWEEVHYPYTYRIEFDGTWLSLLIYGWLTYRMVRQYQSWVAEHFSDIHHIQLNWLKLLLVLLLLLCVQWLIELVLRDGFDVYAAFEYSPFLLAILVCAMAIAGLRQTSMAAVHFQPTPTPSPSLDAAPSLTPEVIQTLQKSMEQDKLYLQPQLTLKQLADHLNLPARQLSEHINQGFDQSFSEWVNGYRAEAVARRIRQGDAAQFTLLALALEAGFNSKTSFNRIFKQHTGLSPSAFKAQITSEQHMVRSNS